MTPKPSRISSVSPPDVSGFGGVVAPPAESPRGEIKAAVDTGSRLVPLAVASALFMEFIDSTALSTALPTLARAFHSDPVHLKLALTSYLLALAVLAPASGWVADRFGARRVFMTAMGFFLLGSVACAASHSLPQLVAARILQGTGGAMMTPVGRLIVVNSAPRERLVSAMAWFTTPALVGPLLGPPLSGLILGVADWPWIFLINVPVGLLGMIAVGRFVPVIKEASPGRFDMAGFLLSACAITSFVVLAETGGLSLIPPLAQAALGAVAIGSLAVFVVYALRRERPILNLRLFAVPTFRASILGGTLVRLGIGATPFLTPLLLQIGLGWSPTKAGLVTISMAAGAMACKPASAPLIRTLGFRRSLLMSVTLTAVMSAVPGFFRAATPIPAMVALFMLGGFVRSLQFTGSNTIAYADIPKERVSQASTISTVMQQVGLSFGVSFGALTLHLARGAANAPLTPDRFTLPYLMIGLTTLLALPVYLSLAKNAGAAISGR